MRNARRYAPMAGDWRPEGARLRFEPPSVGDLVAIGYMALRVWDISPSPHDDGVIRYAFHREHGPKHERENSRGDLAMSVTGRRMWRVYEDGVLPLCSCHGHPWPCEAVCEKRKALYEIARGVEMADRAHDGHCLSCGELVTARQGKVLAPEPNVTLPGFPPPLFHTRQSCRGGLNDYDQRRRARLGADWTPLLSDQPELGSPA